ncbi:flagellar basal-body MS-ring/collar protein FliF [Alicyclobacillus mengziensis]|uniref:flagellar basal-body MS-ring/collar protein FliF n=1 Tax=Alicyclobacillus mengziensis TaxID=2931921 RepID=UPI0020123417|nr:flagellar basal-body MS-ring/collar protein FliF [Alicyclobacillus mengziensis]
MNETIRKYLNKVGLWWQHFNPSQKRNLVIAAVSAILCVIVIAWFLERPNYVTIMSGLDNKSLGQVQTQLETLKIPNKIVGTSVEVPSKDADTARIQLAMKGMPSSGYIGYSSVSNSFGMTQDQFNIQVLDALQQSLNATIQSINGIESAQVHIVMPSQQLFVSQPQSSAKASVFVQLGSGVTLSAAEVAGIQNLVAHAVQGLTPENVSVVDQNGVTLSGNSSQLAAGGAAPSNELSLVHNLEQQVSGQLTSGLNEIVGPGNAVVMVHANVKFNQVKTTSKVFEPAPGQSTGMISSQETVKNSNNQGQTTTVGGVAGQASTNPNLPSYTGTAAGGGNPSNSASTSTITNYQNSEVDTQTVGDPIQVQGYTVGIFLNAADKQLTPQVIAQIKAFVQNAVGISAGAGATNSITVAAVPFQSASSASGSLSPNRSSVFLWGGLGLLGAVLVGLGAVVLVRRRKQATTSEVAVGPEEPVFENLDEVPMTEDEHIKQELARLATRKPEEFANLLRTWLAD